MLILFELILFILFVFELILFVLLLLLINKINNINSLKNLNKISIENLYNKCKTGDIIYFRYKSIFHVNLILINNAKLFIKIIHFQI